MGTVEQSKSLIRDFFEEIWNNANFDFMDQLCTEEFPLNAQWQNAAAQGEFVALRHGVARKPGRNQ
jgi:hypothetical protein